MSEDFVLKTPVVFITFNRPDLAMRVFERIRRARPEKLFIIADGPRASRGGFEIEACRACRSVKDMVDWDCEVFTNFSDVNMGCGKRVSSGLTWVFEHVDEAIIVEDDCQPNVSFFRFCQELLEKYRNDTRIVSIGGYTSNSEYEDQEESYRFASGGGAGWGWATWKRYWDLYDFTMKLWPECRKRELLKHIFPNQDYVNFSNTLQMTYEGRVDTWDYQSAFCARINHGLQIVPKINLVRNIGWNDQRGSHPSHPGAIDKRAFYMDSEITFPLVHPKFMIPMNDAPEIPKPRPSSEEINLEFRQNNTIFQQLSNSGNYAGIFTHFKKVLKDCNFFHLNYVYYLAYAYLMIGDFDHAVDLCNDLLQLGRVQADVLNTFIVILYNNGRVGDVLKIIDTVLQKKLPMNEPFADNMKKIISANESAVGSYPQIAAFIAQ